MALFKFFPLAVAVALAVCGSPVSTKPPPKNDSALNLTLPPLPEIPPLDLSPEGLSDFLRQLTQAVQLPALPGVDGSFTSLLDLLTDLLKRVEGMLLPEPEKEEATQLTDSLRNVLVRQAVVKEKLGALQSMVTDGELAPGELPSLRDIAERLFEQFRALEAQGMEILKRLSDMFAKLFPDLQPTPIPSSEQLEAEQDAVLRAAKALFPDLLN